MTEPLHPAPINSNESILPQYKTNSMVNGTHMKGSANEKAHALNQKSTENQTLANMLAGGSKLQGPPLCQGAQSQKMDLPQDLAPTVSPTANSEVASQHAAETALGAHATKKCTGPAPSPAEIEQPSQTGGSKTKKNYYKKTKGERKTKKRRKAGKNNNSKKNNNSNKKRTIKGILKKRKDSKKTKYSNKKKNSNKNKHSKKTKKVRFN